jgi:hypothetical protein
LLISAGIPSSTQGATDVANRQAVLDVSDRQTFLQVARGERANFEGRAAFRPIATVTASRHFGHLCARIAYGPTYTKDWR